MQLDMRAQELEQIVSLLEEENRLLQIQQEPDD